MLCLEAGPPKNVLYAKRPDKVYEPRKKRKQDSTGTEWSLYAALQTSVPAFRKKAYARIRRVRGTAAQTPTVRKEKCSREKFLLGWARAGVPRVIAIHLSPVYTNIVLFGTQGSLGAYSSTQSAG